MLTYHQPILVKYATGLQSAASKERSFFHYHRIVIVNKDISKYLDLHLAASHHLSVICVTYASTRTAFSSKFGTKQPRSSDWSWIVHRCGSIVDQGFLRYHIVSIHALCPEIKPSTNGCMLSIN